MIEVQTLLAQKRELKEAIEGWNQQKINSFCGQKMIEWIFNPPAASDMGGIWERMIRSVRQILRAMLKELVVSDEVLSTGLAVVTNILSSRPLSRDSESPLDEQPLTRNHTYTPSYQVMFSGDGWSGR